MNMNLRDHGLGESGTPISTPVATKIEEPMPCPNCKCELMKITVELQLKRMVRSRGTRSGFDFGKGTGTYMGCPACPFAGPMITVSGGS